jgi:drug/metabolite transporter (DMT)-like permease
MTRGARGALYGLAAAALFGASAPIAKLLLPTLPPLMMSALLYLGAGLALFALQAVPIARAGEPKLTQSDWPLLLGVVGFGGVLGPALLLFGLIHVSGVMGALLLNLEAPFTIAIALLFFGEHLSRNEATSAAVIIGGAVLLSGAPDVHGTLVGALLIAAACVCWGLDNNLTQRLSLKDPRQIVRFKALGAGAFSLVLALLAHQWRAPSPAWLFALALGAVSYGASIALDVLALRLLGAAREAAFFSTAPFFGAALAVPLLGETFAWKAAAASVVMASGVALLLRARHGHFHLHEPIAHEHLHVHDAHHQHSHTPGTLEAEPHSHWHAHAPLAHDHPHVSDAHHRHRHQ